MEQQNTGQLEDQLVELNKRLAQIKQAVNIDAMRENLRELEVKAAKPDFWRQREEAQNTMRQIGSLKNKIEEVDKVQRSLQDAMSVVESPDFQPEVENIVLESRKKIEDLEESTFLSGEYDQNDAIVSIHAGQGGTEAMDWAQMLLRMYVQYAQKQDWNVELVDQTAGDEAGIKSATILISGSPAYGYLKGEAGTHRLVRQSPFNANNLRQTSFALVEVMPQLGETPDIEIKEDEIEWQFYHASGHGGQNVQKVATAVRLTHKPTGIVVTAQTERFQEQNRKIALDLLRAKLWARKEAMEKEQARDIKGEYRPASWGAQIRSYVLHPYKMVKDLRTAVETSDTDSVLDGDLNDFIQAELRFLGKPLL